MPLVLLLVGLQLSAVRARGISWIDGILRENSGLRISADDFRLSLSSAEIEVVNLSVGTADDNAPAFFSASRIEASFNWSSLLRGAPILYTLELEEPIIDLGAPRPEPSGQAIELRDLRLSGGTVLIPVEGEAADPWFDTLRLEDLQAHGAINGENIQVRDLSAQMVMESQQSMAYGSVVSEDE